MPGLRSPKKSYRYILGDSRREAARLQTQSELWDPVAHALFDRLKIKRGMKVLEVGPGKGSLHLELRRRVQGPVDAVERSTVFAQALASLTQRDGFGPGQIWNQDLIDAPLPMDHYDLIFARWVFLFLPNPLAHLKMLVRALKPGGCLAIEDYHRETLAFLPRPEHWADFMAADRAFFASQGGDVSIGGRLPDLFGQAGLGVRELVPHLKIGRPGSAEWQWLSDYFLGVMDQYAEFRPFNLKKAAQLREHWLKHSRIESSILIAPAVVDVVGYKPLRRTRQRTR